MDFQGPYPNNEYVFVIIDRYSRWPELTVFRNPPNARTTITAMKSIFANKGTPETCQSDNGSPFQSDALAQFATEEGFNHRHVTPEWPRANGTVERFNRSMKEAIQAETIAGVPFREAVTKFARAYRATPHCATGISPHAALHGGREMRTKLPFITKQDEILDREKDIRYKDSMRDNHPGHSIVRGNRVMVTQKKGNKLTPAFSPRPLTVTDVKGSMITARDGDYHITRNATQFRKLVDNGKMAEDCDSSDDEDGDVPDQTVQSSGNEQELRRSSRVKNPIERYGQPTPQ